MQVSNPIPNESKSKAPEKGSPRYDSYLFFNCFLIHSILFSAIASIFFYIMLTPILSSESTVHLLFGAPTGIWFGYQHFRKQKSIVEGLTGEDYENFFKYEQNGYRPVTTTIDDGDPGNPSSALYWTIGPGRNDRSMWDDYDSTHRWD